MHPINNAITNIQNVFIQMYVVSQIKHAEDKGSYSLHENLSIVFNFLFTFYLLR